MEKDYLHQSLQNIKSTFASNDRIKVPSLTYLINISSQQFALLVDMKKWYRWEHRPTWILSWSWISSPTIYPGWSAMTWYLFCSRLSFDSFISHLLQVLLWILIEIQNTNTETKRYHTLVFMDQISWPDQGFKFFQLY